MVGNQKLVANSLCNAPRQRFFYISGTKMNYYTIVWLTCVVESIANSVTFEALKSLDGKSTYHKGLPAILQCTVDEYKGALTFLFDSKKVFSCTGSQCNVLENYSGAFVFSYNMTSNGVFTWKINEIKNEYDGKLFQCFDGSERKNITLSVIGHTSGCNRLNSFANWKPFQGILFMHQNFMRTMFILFWLLRWGDALITYFDTMYYLF